MRNKLSQLILITFDRSLRMVSLEQGLRGEGSQTCHMLSAKQGSIWYYFYNVFGMTRSGTEPTTSRSRGERSNHWATAAVNIVICPCKNITEKMNLLKMFGPQIRLCLFTFRSIASKQLNSFATIVTFSCLCMAELGHPRLVREVPGSIQGSGKGFYVWFFGLLLLCFYFFVYKHIICHKKMQFLLQC